jgi:hypothetical protein
MVDNNPKMGYNKNNNESDRMQSNNVIMFPKQYHGPAAPSLDEIIENTDMMKHFHIQETLNNLIPLIFTHLDIAGFEFEDEEDAASMESIKEGAFLVEALRALMCRHYGIYHPFQDLWEKIFQYDSSKTEPVLRILDKIDIEFKKKDEN